MIITLSYHNNNNHLFEAELLHLLSYFNTTEKIFLLSILIKAFIFSISQYIFKPSFEPNIFIEQLY